MRISTYYPNLAKFSEATYTRVRRGKREIVRKGRKKKSRTVPILSGLGAAVSGGFLGHELTKSQIKNTLDKQSRKLADAVAKAGGEKKIMAMSHKDQLSFIGKHGGKALENFTKPGGAAKYIVAPRVVGLTAGALGGALAYGFARSRQNKKQR